METDPTRIRQFFVGLHEVNGNGVGNRPLHTVGVVEATVPLPKPDVSGRVTFAESDGAPLRTVLRSPTVPAHGITFKRHGRLKYPDSVKSVALRTGWRAGSCKEHRCLITSGFQGCMVIPAVSGGGVEKGSGECRLVLPRPTDCHVRLGHGCPG